MKMSLYEKSDYSKFIGKWCLVKDSIGRRTYTRYFIIGISDDVVKYKNSSGIIEYVDLCRFPRSTDIKIDPFSQCEADSDTKLNEDWNIGHSSSSSGGCNHEWIDLVYPTYPPQYGKVCKHCGEKVYDNFNLGCYAAI